MTLIQPPSSPEAMVDAVKLISLLIAALHQTKMMFRLWPKWAFLINNRAETDRLMSIFKASDSRTSFHIRCKNCVVWRPRQNGYIMYQYLLISPNNFTLIVNNNVNEQELNNTTATINESSSSARFAVCMNFQHPITINS